MMPTSPRTTLLLLLNDTASTCSTGYSMVMLISRRRRIRAAWPIFEYCFCIFPPLLPQKMPLFSSTILLILFVTSIITSPMADLNSDTAVDMLYFRLLRPTRSAYVSSMSATE